ncbi:MAG: hypothetical protein KGD63_02985 [Candidatus Lokiarchaeota archaeon]|nr:hypothetical protein [Candidatus Lokiarchaeota archaeon]
MDSEFVNSIIILIILFVIFGIFLVFDVFKRNERYRYLAYIVALFPVNYMWAVKLDITYLGFNQTIILSYIILFLLWTLCILRDIILVYRKTNDYNDIFLFFMLAVIVQIIISGILPYIDTTLQTLDATTNPPIVGIFFLPDIYASGVVDPNLAMAFKVLMTVLIIFIMGPILLDIKGEEVPFPVLLIVDAIFFIPFLILSYIWVPLAMWVLTILFSVILFIILLIITRSGKETK